LNLDALLDQHILSDAMITMALKREGIEKAESGGKAAVLEKSSS
jgi:hypothetical protein